MAAAGRGGSGQVGPPQMPPLLQEPLGSLLRPELLRGSDLDPWLRRVAGNGTEEEERAGKHQAMHRELRAHHWHEAPRRGYFGAQKGQVRLPLRPCWGCRRAQARAAAAFPRALQGELAPCRSGSSSPAALRRLFGTGGGLGSESRLLSSHLAPRLTEEKLRATTAPCLRCTAATGRFSGAAQLQHAQRSAGGQQEQAPSPKMLMHGLKQEKRCLHLAGAVFSPEMRAIGDLWAHLACASLVQT